MAANGVWKSWFAGIASRIDGYTSTNVNSPAKGRFVMSDEKTYKFVCVVCGFEVEVDTPELPEDYVCPVCGVGPDEFEAVEE